MATKRGFRRSVKVQDHQIEDTYGTTPSGTYTLHMVDSDPFQLTSELVDDTDLISNSEEATSLVELSRSTSGSLNFPRVKPHSLAMIAAYAMSGGTGNPADTRTALVATGTTDSRHVIKPNLTDFLLSSVTIYDELDPAATGSTVLGYLYTGMMVSDFTLSCDRKGWFSLQSNWVGSGARTKQTSTIAGSEIGSEVPLKAGDATVYIVAVAGGAGGLDGSPDQGVGGVSAASLTGSELSGFNAKVVSFNWGYSNNLDESNMYQFSGGKVKNLAERVRRSQTLSMTVEFADEVELDYLTDQDTLSLEVNCISSVVIGGGTSKNYGFDLMFPLTKLLSANVSGGTDKMSVDMEFQVLQHSTNGSVQLDVYNAAATAYATT